jgi:hypothetical protein
MQRENDTWADRDQLVRKLATLCLSLLSSPAANEIEQRLVAKELVRAGRFC